MDLADEAVARLNGLALFNDVDLVLMVRDLVRSATAWAPCCLAVIITLGDEESVHVIDDRLQAGSAIVRASLRAQLTAPGPGRTGRHVVFLSERAGEFEDFAALTLRPTGPADRRPHRVVIDGDLAAAVGLTGNGQLVDVAADPAVDRAVGVLLDRGYPPDEARQELADQARASGRSRLEQARRILRSPTQRLGGSG
jgi:hypothetical protein